jgi:hypothetical protein
MVVRTRLSPYHSWNKEGVQYWSVNIFSLILYIQYRIRDYIYSPVPLCRGEEIIHLYQCRQEGEGQAVSWRDRN